MFITYIYRNGWRRSLLAFINLMIVLSVATLAGGLMAINSSRPFYEELSRNSGFGGGPLFGSPLVEYLLNPITMWAFIAAVIALVIKEFFSIPLGKRLAINTMALLLGFAVATYVIHILATPIFSAT